jgi:hypothetical protein
MISASKCPHAAAQQAASLPGVPCEECRAFVDRDGSLMTADVARQRYPVYRTSFDENEARWHSTRSPMRPKQRANILGRSEQERKSNIKFLAWCALALSVVVFVVWVVAFSHKPASETPAEKAASYNCPSFSARANGECGSVQSDEQAKQKEEVESEQHEGEAVIKKRKAEGTASAIEEATK